MNTSQTALAGFDGGAATFGTQFAVCNNAAWALGESFASITVALSPNHSHLKQVIEPFSAQIFENVTKLLSQQKLNKQLALTLAGTLGRIALIMTD